MPKAYDGPGLTTFSALSVSGNDFKGQNKTRSFLTWQSTANAYTALTLNINASFFPEIPAQGCIKYSTDNGNTYTTVKCDGGNQQTQQTYSVTLSATQDLSKLRVSACVFGGQGRTHADVPPGFDSITIWDIWTSGTNPAPATGNGSTAGQPHRAVVVTN